MKKIKALITKCKPLLTDSEYLSHNYFETSNVYGRPKIHKSETLHKGIKEQNNPKALPIIKQTLENLKTSDRMRNALKKVKLINGKRQAPSL